MSISPIFHLDILYEAHFNNFLLNLDSEGLQHSPAALNPNGACSKSNSSEKVSGKQKQNLRSRSIVAPRCKNAFFAWGNVRTRRPSARPLVCWASGSLRKIVGRLGCDLSQRLCSSNCSGIVTCQDMGLRADSDIHSCRKEPDRLVVPISDFATWATVTDMKDICHIPHTLKTLSKLW